jgi:hypothetical protein
LITTLHRLHLYLYRGRDREPEGKKPPAFTRTRIDQEPDPGRQEAACAL